MNQGPASPKRIVILDTNALLMPFQFKLNLESELDRLLGSYSIIIPSVVIDELEKLSKSNSYARSALQLAKKYEILELENTLIPPKKLEHNIDFAIVALAKKLDAIVLTNDKILRANLRKENLKTVFLKSSTHLEID